MISVLILTLNEEINLPRCLQSLQWCDDIVVLDSGSTDRTVEIATAAGARVFTRKLDNWADHQNWALKEITYKYPWIYYSDADEVVTDELRDELQSIAAANNDQPVAYQVRYKNYFMSRWIKHCGIYPTWVTRFFRPEKIRWERLVNPVAVVDGQTGHLKGHFEHYSFNKGLDAWFDKHNRYSTQEAMETIRAINAKRLDIRGLWCRNDPARRRQALKLLSFRMPCRALLRFIYMYFIRLGFLDGRPGLRYCIMLSMYEMMISLKVKELRLREQNKTV